MVNPDAPPVLEAKFMDLVYPVFTQASRPELRIVELEGVESFKNMWDPLEAAVPSLVMCHTRRYVSEKRDPSFGAKF